MKSLAVMVYTFVYKLITNCNIYPMGLPAAMLPQSRQKLRRPREAAALRSCRAPTTAAMARRQVEPTACINFSVHLARWQSLCCGRNRTSHQTANDLSQITTARRQW
jgi:hypothetical protein